MSNATLTTLHKSVNWFKATGTVSEKYSIIKDKNGAYERVPMFVEKTTRDEYKDGQKTGKTIPCEKIFGGIILKTKDGVCEFKVNFNNKNADGSDSKKWPMAMKILNWNPIIDGDGKRPASYVTMSGSVSNYDSYSKKKNEVYSNLQWGATAKCESAEYVEFEEGVDNSGCTLRVVGFLVSKVWEPDRNNPEETTGRMKVKLMLGGNNGECFPLNVIVDEELAEDFNDAFKTGETIDCIFDRVVRTVGGKKKETGRGLGKKAGPSQELNSSFTIEELILNNIDPVDEPDELTTEDENGNEIEVKTNWINPKTMKMAMKIREEKLSELKANGGKKNKPAGSAGSIADAINESKNKLGKKNKFEDFEDFDDEIDNDTDFFSDDDGDDPF